MFALALFPLHCSVSLSKPKALTGRDAIRVVSWIGPKLQKKVKQDASITGAEQEPCWFGAVTAELLQFFLSAIYCISGLYEESVFVWFRSVVIKKEQSLEDYPLFPGETH